jgi:putative transcriptional regulator
MGKSSDEYEHEKLRLTKDIIGEIGVSEDPPANIKKWRTLFRISQKELAKKLGISSSVISDYESGRRKSPGVLFLRRYVDSLIGLDEGRGGEVIRLFSSGEGSAPASAAIVDIKEFPGGVRIVDFCESVGAKIITKKAPSDGVIYGYTIIDSVKAITEMPFGELRKLYGVTTRRALIFTNITTGKGPLIAIKVANLKPALIVLHNIPEASVSEVAKNIAEVEGVPLSICEKTPLEEIVAKSGRFSTVRG